MSRFFQALSDRQRREPAAPFVTWYGPGAARAELSAVTFATSVAKTAGVLVDDLELQPGDSVRLALPLHWQLPVWLGACDVAGLVVDWPQPGEGPTAGSLDHEAAWRGVALVAVPDPEAVAVPQGVMVVVSAATPFGLPSAEVRPPLVDHHRASLGQPDHFAGPVLQGSWHVAGSRWDGGGIEDRARALGAGCGLQPGGRLLVGPQTDSVTAALACWALPLVSGASVVLVQEGAGRDIGATERVTATL